MSEKIILSVLMNVCMYVRYDVVAVGALQQKKWETLYYGFVFV